MGVMCESCRTVHFVATSHYIRPIVSMAGMYRLNCTLPCPEVREFRKESMCPYRVSEDVFKSGHAKEGEYALVQIPKQPQPPQGR
jgi:hypothetical protein